MVPCSQHGCLLLYLPPRRRTRWRVAPTLVLVDYISSLSISALKTHFSPPAQQHSTLSSISPSSSSSSSLSSNYVQPHKPYICAYNTHSYTHTTPLFKSGHLFTQQICSASPVQLSSHLKSGRVPSHQSCSQSLAPMSSTCKSGRVITHRFFSESLTITQTDNDLVVASSPAAQEDSMDLMVLQDFVSVQEEERLMREVERTLRGNRYLYDHWDGAIEGYRETEKSQWREENRGVIRRLMNIASQAGEKEEERESKEEEEERKEEEGERKEEEGERKEEEGERKEGVLEEVHVLDLAKNGFIKPHIDSVKFCGHVIAGISLLSSSVMQFSHEQDNSRIITTLLPQRSLYIIRGVMRYHYTHAILPVEASEFKGQRVERERRVSIISRSRP